MRRSLAIAAMVLAALAVLATVIGMRSAQQPDLVLSEVELQASDSDGDVALYRQLAGEVSAGANYYESAVRLHRERDYPLKPFFTVRLPTLAHATATLGSLGMVVLAWLLVFAGIALWYTRDPSAPLIEKLGVAALLAMGGASFVNPSMLYLHEGWAGLLLTLAFALKLRGQWWAALAVAALALAIREFAVIFVGAMGFHALIQRRWKRAGVAMLVGLVFLAAMAMHAQQVNALVLPDDLPSPAWQGLRGPAGFVSDIAGLTFLQTLPSALAVILVAVTLAGWLTLPREQSLFAALWLGGFALLVMLFARANNYYWIAVVLPALMLGLPFAIGALLRRLGGASGSDGTAANG